MTTAETLLRRIPLAITAALLLQAGTAIWWAATTSAETQFQRESLTNLETLTEKTSRPNRKSPTASPTSRNG